MSRDKQKKKNASHKKTALNKSDRNFLVSVKLAAEQCGSNGRGKDGLVGYLTLLALRKPKIFARLLLQILVLESTSTDGGGVQVIHIDPFKLKDLSPEDMNNLDKVISCAMVQQQDPEPDPDPDPADYERTLN